MPILEDLQKIEGYELRTFAVPPPGVEMGAQVLDITQRYRPDFVIDHLFGRSPSVAIKEYKRAGFPLSKVMGLVWASAEADIEAAGGWERRRGLSHDAIRRRRRRLSGPPGNQGDVQGAGQGAAEGDGRHGRLQPRPAVAALHVEAIRNAIKANGGQKPTGEQVKKGFESIHDVTLGGLVPPLKITRRTTRAAAGCRSSRPRAASSSRRRSGSAPIRRSSPTPSRRRNSITADRRSSRQDCLVASLRR